MNRASSLRWLVGVALIASVGLAEAQIAPPSPPKPPFADPQDAIAARKIGFKGNGDVAKAMKGAVDGGKDVSGFVPDAQYLVDWGKQIPGMFPVGSETGHETKALPAIWTNKADFDKDAANFSDAAAKLVTLAQANDKAGFATQFQALGDTCGACHKSYRGK